MVGIGGINQTNASGVILAGAKGVAVVSAIISHPDPGGAARTLKSKIDAALKEVTPQYGKKYPIIV
jgi:thiamine-phosphate pyrophosphorylase